ncbi:MAG: hypothetical protein O7J95_07440 [Planctomycetota bacterium]|nr:hypothetical protein [Planctomycetota bacterium]
MRKSTAERQSGALLFEITLALAMLTVGVLAFLSSFFTNYRAVQTINEMDTASVALASVAEEITGVPLADVFANYNGQLIPVTGLKGADGLDANIQVICHVDEGSIPAAFGPVVDIDGDPGSVNANASASYDLLPVELSLTYATSQGLETQEVFIVLYAD